MIVRWSGAAADDLRDAQAYVEEFDPGAAGRMVARIVLTANKMLAQYPEIGRPGRVSGTRELEHFPLNMKHRRLKHIRSA